jgi:hypothetical protein
MQRRFHEGRLQSFSLLNEQMVRNRIAENLLVLPRAY